MAFFTVNEQQSVEKPTLRNAHKMNFYDIRSLSVRLFLCSFIQHFKPWFHQDEAETFIFHYAARFKIKTDIRFRL